MMTTPVKLGFEKYKTPTMGRYNRASAGSAEKDRQDTKRKLELQQERSSLCETEVLMDLSSLPGPTDQAVEMLFGENNLPGSTDMVDQNDKEQW